LRLHGRPFSERQDVGAPVVGERVELPSDTAGQQKTPRHLMVAKGLRAVPVGVGQAR